MSILYYLCKWIKKWPANQIAGNSAEVLTPSSHFLDLKSFILLLLFLTYKILNDLPFLILVHIVLSILYT